MTLANPWGLLGLLTLPAILILHLLRERQRRLVVSNLALWSFLDVELRGSRFKRLPITWLLFLDLLIAALLTVAWTQPRLNLALPVRGERHVVLLLDVSTSMRASDELPTRFDRSRLAAAGLLSSLGSRDVATVVAFGDTARTIGDTRRDGLQDLLTRMNGLQAGETGHELRAALALGQAALDPTLPNEFYVYTDGAFPADRALVSQELQDFPYPIHWELAGKPANNRAIIEISVTPLSENRVQVFARLANFGDQAVNPQVNLSLDDTVVSRDRISLPPNSTVPKVWTVTGSPAAVTVSMEGGDVLKEDDTASIGMQSGGKVRVALVTDHPSPLQQALSAIPQVDLKVIAPKDYTPENYQPAFELTVFRSFVPDAWPSGEILMAEPPTGTQSTDASFLVRRGSMEIPNNTPIQLAADPLLTGVDFNGVRWGRAWRLGETPAALLPLIQAGGAPLALRGTVQADNGQPARLTVLTVDLNRGNFAKHPAFPILLANLVQGLRQAALPPSLHTGEAVPLPLASAQERLWILPPGAEPAAFQGQWPESFVDTTQPGVYRFELQNPAGKSAVYLVGVNAGETAESDLRGDAQAQGGVASAGNTPGLQDTRGLNLAPWFLTLAVAVLIAEAMLAWR